MEHNKALEGAAVGGVSGIVLGGTLSCLMALGILAIPGVGPLIAAGPIICHLGRRGAGAVAGGVTESIIGMRMPAFEAIKYQGEMGGGNVLISVLTSDATERDRVKAISRAPSRPRKHLGIMPTVWGRGSCDEPTAVHTRGDA